MRSLPLPLLLLLLPSCSDGVLSSGELSEGEPAPDARRIGILDGSANQRESGFPPPLGKDSGTIKREAGTLPSPDQVVPPPPKPDQGVPKPDSSSALGLSAQEKDLLDAINAARAKLGLSTLTVDPMLLCAARLAAQVVPPTGSCGHVGSDGSWASDRAKTCGMASGAAGYVNEIAAGPGFTDGADAVWGWSQSSGHWWGLTHPKAKTIGVSATSKGCYWAVFDCCISGSE